MHEAIVVPSLPPSAAETPSRFLDFLVQQRNIVVHVKALRSRRANHTNADVCQLAVGRQEAARRRHTAILQVAAAGEKELA
jgi:hypothetical protein